MQTMSYMENAKMFCRNCWKNKGWSIRALPDGKALFMKKVCFLMVGIVREKE